MNKDILTKYGFVYRKHSRAGGQDQWAGMDFWHHRIDSNLILRGNCRGNICTISLYPYFNSLIQSEQDIIDLFRILNIRID